MGATKSVRSITGGVITSGTLEEAVPLVMDGVGAAAIAVPAGTNVVITDIIVGGLAESMWRIQQTNDGVTWFDIALFNISAASVTSTPQHSFNTGLVINGGASVAFRARVETPGGATETILTLRSYSEA